MYRVSGLILLDKREGSKIFIHEIIWVIYPDYMKEAIINVIRCEILLRIWEIEILSISLIKVSIYHMNSDSKIRINVKF
jgi:hypothetical protein